MKKISVYVVALLVVLACASFVSCTNIYTLGLSEVSFDSIMNNASGNYTLKTVSIVYGSNGTKNENTTNGGTRSSTQVKTEIAGIQVLTGAKAYANPTYSKIVLYKCLTDNSGNKTAEYWYQYTR